MQIVAPESAADAAMVNHGPFDALAQGDDWRGKLERLDAVLATLPQTEMPVAHYFSRGVYARELFIPAGTVLTGRIHKHSQINILLYGEISVLTESGIVRLKAPCVFESPAGAKRAGYAHSDTAWLTICGTNTTDPDALVDELTTRTYAEYEAHCASLPAPGETKWLSD